MAALQDKLYLYKHRPLLQTTAAPASQGFGFILLPMAGLTALPGLPRAVGVGLQAHAVPTEPSARIGSTTGGIRGFGRLIREFTFKVFV